MTAGSAVVLDGAPGTAGRTVWKLKIVLSSVPGAPGSEPDWPCAFGCHVMAGTKTCYRSAFRNGFLSAALAALRMERRPYNQLRFPDKLWLKFDLASNGRLLLCAVLVGGLAGMVAAGFFLSLQGVQYAVSSLYNTAGISFPVVPRRSQLVRNADSSHSAYFTRPAVVKPAQTDPEYGEPEEPTYPAPDPLGTTGARLGEHVQTDEIFGYFIVPKYWLLFLLIPGFGGLLCGIVVCSFAREATAEGTDCIIKAYHLRNGIIRFRLVLVKTLSSLITLGSGGSAGWEGPTALVGAGAGSLFSRFLKTNAAERRLLLLAGTAGGIGAIFQVPLGGALFAVEILYCTFAVELGAFLPCLLASAAGYTVFRQLVGPSIPIDPQQIVHFEWGWPLLVHLPLILLFAILCTGIGWTCLRGLHEMRNRVFRRLAIPEFVKPAIGGILLGCVAIFYPQVFGGGYEWITGAIEGTLSLKLMAALVLAKILATTLTIASGGSGGLLGPSIFIGAMLGGAFGAAQYAVFDALGLPHLAPHPSAFVVLGMAAFYGGIGKVPLAAAVITCEIVGGSYFFAIPLFLAAIAHFALQSTRVSLYEEQVLTPLESPAHFGDYVVELLQAMDVKRVATLSATEEPPRSVLIPRTASIQEVMRKISSSTDTFFPVVDENRSLIGLISLGDVRSAFVSLGDWRLLIADDLAQLPDMYVLPDDSLYTVLRICRRGGIVEIPVIDAPETRRVIGVIRRHEIIAAYNDAISRYREG